MTRHLHLHPPEPGRRSRAPTPAGLDGPGRVVHLIAGEYLVVTEPGQVLATTLGSCVAACLFDPVLGIGGMNHFLLPEAPDDKVGASARYGNVSMERLVNGLLCRGSARPNLMAKVFGGASMGTWRSDIGARNVEFVMAYLAEEGVKTVAWDVGGPAARSIRFVPTTGEGFVRTIADAASGQVARQERALERRLRERPVDGEVELFA